MVESAPVTRDFFNPSPEKQSVALVNAATVHEAERLIESARSRTKPPGRELADRSPHERGEVLWGDLQVGLPGEFFDRDPIDVAQVQYGSQPIPSALNTRERKKVLVQTMKQIGELRIMVR